MKISKKSTSFRLYKMIWRHDPPNNLCPFFWQLIAAGLLFLIVFPLQLPLRVPLLIKAGKKEINMNTESVFVESLKGAILWAVLIIIGVHFYNTYHLIRAFIGCYSYDSTRATIAASIWITLILVIVCVLIARFVVNLRDRIEELHKTLANERLRKGEITQEQWLYEYYGKDNKRRPRKPNLLKEFIKAKMGKYCPKIEWI